MSSYSHKQKGNRPREKKKNIRSNLTFSLLQCVRLKKGDFKTLSAFLFLWLWRGNVPSLFLCVCVLRNRDNFFLDLWFLFEVQKRKKKWGGRSNKKIGRKIGNKQRGKNKQQTAFFENNYYQHAKSVLKRKEMSRNSKTRSRGYSLLLFFYFSFFVPFLLSTKCQKKLARGLFSFSFCFGTLIFFQNEPDTNKMNLAARCFVDLFCFVSECCVTERKMQFSP